MQRIWASTPRQNLIAGSSTNFTNFGGTWYELDVNLTDEERLRGLKRICIAHGVRQHNWKQTHVIIQDIEEVRLDNCTVKYLQSLCSYLGIAGYSRMSVQERRVRAQATVGRFQDHVEVGPNDGHTELIIYNAVDGESSIPEPFPDTEQDGVDSGGGAGAEIMWPTLPLRDRRPEQTQIHYPSLPTPVLSPRGQEFGHNVRRRSPTGWPQTRPPPSPRQLEGSSPGRQASGNEIDRLQRENRELGDRVSRLGRQLSVSIEEQSQEVHSLQDRLRERREEVRELQRHNADVLTHNTTLQRDAAALRTQLEASEREVLRSQSQVVDLEAAARERERQEEVTERTHRQERGRLEQELETGRQDFERVQQQVTDLLRQRLLGLRGPASIVRSTSSRSNTTSPDTRRSETYSSSELEDRLAQQSRAVKQRYEEMMRRREDEWETSMHETRQELERQHQEQLMRLQQNHEQQIRDLHEHHERLVETEQHVGREMQQRVNELRARLAVELRRNRELGHELEFELGRQSEPRNSVHVTNHTPNRRANLASPPALLAEVVPLRLSRSRSVSSTADTPTRPPIYGPELSDSDNTRIVGDGVSTTPTEIDDQDTSTTSSSRPTSPSDDQAAMSLYDSLDAADLIEISGVGEVEGEHLEHPSPEGIDLSEADSTGRMQSTSGLYDAPSTQSSQVEDGPPRVQTPPLPGPVPLQVEFPLSPSTPQADPVSWASVLPGASQSPPPRLPDLDSSPPSVPAGGGVFTSDPPRRSIHITSAAPDSLWFVPPTPRVQPQPAQTRDTDQATGRASFRDKTQFPPLAWYLREGNRLVQGLFASRRNRPAGQ